MRRTEAHQEARDWFARYCPEGFESRKYLWLERCYKLAAGQRWQARLGGGQLEAQAVDGARIRESALFVFAGTEVNLLSRFEIIALREMLDLPEAAARFAAGLHDFLDSTRPIGYRMDRWGGVLSKLPSRGQRIETWSIATLFPYLAAPDDYPFLKPEVTQGAAERCRYALNYDSAVNGLTYDCLIDLYRWLLEDLKDLGARDSVDVQSFIWMTNAKDYEAKANQWLLENPMPADFTGC